MKLKKSKLLSIALSVPVVSLMLVNSGFAASSISSSIGGVSVSGNLSTYSYGASASTTIGTTLGTAYASATYNYKFGDVNTIRTSTASASNTVSAYASAGAAQVPAVFISASGTHSASYTSSLGQYYSWSGNTSL